MIVLLVKACRTGSIAFEPVSIGMAPEGHAIFARPRTFAWLQAIGQAAVKIAHVGSVLGVGASN
jgi:hypothetical protein